MKRGGMSPTGNFAVTAAASVCVLLALAACNHEAPHTVNSSAAYRAPPERAMSPSITQMESTELAPGAGEAIVNGQGAVVHYTGWLYNPEAPDHKGTKFDSSRDRGQPFRFSVGAGRVIKGWDQGVAGMKVGGRRLLVIPASLGYGERGAGGIIPPNATLLFDVELLAIEAR